MGIIFLVVMAMLTHAYISDETWDNSAEDIFSSSSSGTFDDVNFVSSVLSEDSPGEVAGANLVAEDSFNWDSLSMNSPCQDFSIGSKNIFAEDNLLVGPEDHLAAFYPEDEFEDHFFETRDLLADYSPVEDVSMNSFDSWSPAANTQDYLLSSNVKGDEVPKKWREYHNIDPKTPSTVDFKSAYSDDGVTPIRPGLCPHGKRRTCCDWTAPDPFRVCQIWTFARFYEICQPAMNLFCCDSVDYPDVRYKSTRPGIGRNCERQPWRTDRERREATSEQSSENSFQDLPQGSFDMDLQEAFPILQPLPDLNPGYCPNPL